MSTDDSDTRAQAAYWALRMSSDDGEPVSEPERQQFVEWLARSPRHEQEYQAALMTMNAAADLPQHERAYLNALSSESSAGVSGGRRQLFKMAALAASALVALVAGGVFMESQGWFGQTWTTRTGENDTATFPEGSVAYLNTRTQLRWTGSESQRRVELLQGEALFDVVHDERRPFTVTLEGSEIRVLGTRFNVYRKTSGDVIVTVLEGSVEVRGFGQGGQPEWVRKLEANQQIEYRTIGLVREPHAMDAQKAAQWRSALVLMESEPLSKLVYEFTRYTDDRIVIRDPRLADLLISGAYSTRDVASTLHNLALADPVIEVREGDGVITLDYRAQASK